MDNLKNFISGIGQQLSNLAERWLDEQGYEDIKEYQAVLQKAATPFGVTIKSMVKKPFGFNFTIEGDTKEYRIVAKLRRNSVAVEVSTTA